MSNKIQNGWINHLRAASRQHETRLWKCPVCEAKVEPELNQFRAHVRHDVEKHGILDDAAITEYLTQMTLGPSSKLRSLPHSTKDQAGSGPDDHRQPHTSVEPQETRPISLDQLITEVRGIYGGLTTIEVKCIQVDESQAQYKTTQHIDATQWQALIALHRTLLHEHHDFFLASQHPAANDSVRKLAAKYAMPSRMWRYGIHSFLEILRNRLPASKEDMLTFIYLAYSMMALLYETVSGFDDTWVECIGDLARLRRALEDCDSQDREMWANVTAGWYSIASQKMPTTGRLYHHLAIFTGTDVGVEDTRLSALESIMSLCQSLFRDKIPYSTLDPGGSSIEDIGDSASELLSNDGDGTDDKKFRNKAMHFLQKPWNMWWSRLKSRMARMGMSSDSARIQTILGLGPDPSSEALDTYMKLARLWSWTTIGTNGKYSKSRPSLKKGFNSLRFVTWLPALLLFYAQPISASEDRGGTDTTSGEAEIPPWVFPVVFSFMIAYVELAGRWYGERRRWLIIAMALSNLLFPLIADNDRISPMLTMSVFSMAAFFGCRYALMDHEELQPNSWFYVAVTCMGLVISAIISSISQNTIISGPSSGSSTNTFSIFLLFSMTISIVICGRLLATYKWIENRVNGDHERFRGVAIDS